MFLSLRWQTTKERGKRHFGSAEKGHLQAQGNGAQQSCRAGTVT
jgi:hypothetical protein